MTTLQSSTGWFAGFCVAVAGVVGLEMQTWGVPPQGIISDETPLWIATEKPSARSNDMQSDTRSAAEVASIKATGVGADTCNAAVVSPLAVPGSLTVFGDSTGVTADACFSDVSIWWEAFEITESADVTLDFCGTDPKITLFLVRLMTECASDGSTCGGTINQDFSNRFMCPDIDGVPDDNITIGFRGLPAGVYYFPIGSFAPGPYQMNLNAGPFKGACCNFSTGVCNDLVLETDCDGADQSFTAGVQCCEVECRDPSGPEFDSSGVTLLSRVTLEDLATFAGTPGNPSSANEMWGYTSPSGREYAIMGTTTGTGYVDVTRPADPVIVGFIDDGVFGTRDMAIFGELAYVTAGSLELQIIDLSDIDNGNVTEVKRTDLGIGFTSSHNVYINAASATLYLPFSNLNDAIGLPAVSLADPLNPVLVGTWTDAVADVSCHDVQVITYTSGPNAGKEIAFCFAAEHGLKIVDVTNKASMVTLSTLDYGTVGLCHQGWASENGRYVFIGDEFDEFSLVAGMTTYVADVLDLENPTLASTFEYDACNVDHNMMVRGDYLYQANYAAGLRVLDFTSPPNLTEFAHFDTRPEDNATDFVGAWGVFTDYASGIVVLSDRQRGLFVFANPEPPPPPPLIPTASGWGLWSMALLLLVAGTIAVRRAQPALVEGAS